MVVGAMVLFTGCSDFLEQDNRSDVPTDGSIILPKVLRA